MKEDKFADKAMSDEELNNVSGSGNIETANDSRFLNVLTNGKCDRYGEYRISGGSHNAEIKKAWAYAGIEAELYADDHTEFYDCISTHNTYKCMDTGESLTQEQARQYAMNFVGRQLKESDWNW